MVEHRTKDLFSIGWLTQGAVFGLFSKFPHPALNLALESSWERAKLESPWEGVSEELGGRIR